MSLTVGSTSVDIAAMLLCLLMVGLILDTAIRDALVVGFNLGLALEMLLNKSKCVHWIPPVRFVVRSFGQFASLLCGR